MEYGGSTPFSTTSVQHFAGKTAHSSTGAALDHQDRNSRSRERRRAAVLNYEEPGSLRTPGRVPWLAPPLATETRTEEVENGVEPPYSISGGRRGHDPCALLGAWCIIWV